jgi:site-specific recombinase XerD
MFDHLYTKPAVIARHQDAPYREERERYLRHCEQQGFSILTLLLLAKELLWIARKLRICPEQAVTLQQVNAVAQDWSERECSWGRKINAQYTRLRFVQVARTWLRFLGYWRDPEQLVPFRQFAENYLSWMSNDRGLTDMTIQSQSGYLRQFFCWFGSRSSQFSAVSLNDVDAFLAKYGAKGNCRKSVKNMASTLRVFFRYAGTQGWCLAGIAPEIHGPRIFAQEDLPRGPSWPDVNRLIASMNTSLVTDIRDQAIVMLLAIYGFRATEVTTLRLDDIDWEQNLLSVARVKRRGRQTYPLIPLVGNAIIRYVQEVRPRSLHREIFLTLKPPFRPISRSGLYDLTNYRMKTLGITAPHFGPHALRHAYATHLAAEGLSLKEIGDHLGHRSANATRIYAKIDLPGLREVATFDAGGLL